MGRCKKDIITQLFFAKTHQYWRYICTHHNERYSGTQHRSTEDVSGVVFVVGDTTETRIPGQIDNEDGDEVLQKEAASPRQLGRHV